MGCAEVVEKLTFAKVVEWKRGGRKETDPIAGVSPPAEMGHSLIARFSFQLFYYVSSLIFTLRRYLLLLFSRQLHASTAARSPQTAPPPLGLSRQLHRRFFLRRRFFFFFFFFLFSHLRPILAVISLDYLLRPILCFFFFFSADWPWGSLLLLLLLCFGSSVSGYFPFPSFSRS
ncbi:hypothetical protein L484_019130 [Morus notabilis]|uniref:Transmembrane protein n=1 Tax=Morus notabilis TaxID=981085 RepID=W9SJ98_9ROSA|nr:hypothetical protein L484_019130 [Morus notabilis]